MYFNLFINFEYSLDLSRVSQIKLSGVINDLKCGIEIWMNGAKIPLNFDFEYFWKSWFKNFSFMCENSILQQRLQYFSYSMFENLAFFSEYSSSLNLTSNCDKAKPFKKKDRPTIL